MIKILLITVSLLFTSQSALALTVFDPTNHKENLATKLQMIEQVKNSAQQLQNDIKNLQKLDISNLSQSYYQIKSVISTMEQIRAQTDAIGTEYSQFMTDWQEINPDYEEWNGVGADQYAKQTKKLRDKWSKALLQALGISSIASSTEQYKTEQALKALLDASQNASGTMGALQAANQLTSLMINEQQKLQVLMADSMRSQNMYYQAIIDGEKQATQTNSGFLKNKNKYQNIQLKGRGEQLPQFRE